MVTAAEALVRSLDAHDVDYLFGVCGDTSVGFYRELATTDHDVAHVLARDERSAAFMADAYARLSDKPGVCEGPSGGGATYLLPGLAEAQDSSIPLVALNTSTPVRYRGRGVLTELDQTELFAPVTKWNASADHPDSVSRLVREAFRRATAGRPGAVHLSFPMDVIAEETDEPIYAEEGSTRYPAHRPRPERERLDRAVEVIQESDRPAIVAGGGVHSSRAWESLRRLAEHAGIPVAQTLTSAGCIGDSPYDIGVVGENGARAYAEEIVSDADTILLFGTAVESVWTRKWSAPPDRQKTIIHADVDDAVIGRNYETAVGLPGDLRRTLDWLVEYLSATSKWDAGTIESAHAEWAEPFEREFDSDAFPLRPERMVAGASEVFDDDTVIISDPGTSCPFFAALYPFSEPGRHWVTPRAHGALGYSVPGVVGAQLACPDQPVVGFIGDGGLGTCAGELETIARLDLPVTIVVVNNGAFSWIEAGQRSHAEFSFGVHFDEVEFATLAGSFGLEGFTVESADEYESVLGQAVRADAPTLVDLPVEPLPDLENVPVDWLEPAG